MPGLCFDWNITDPSTQSLGGLSSSGPGQVQDFGVGPWSNLTIALVSLALAYTLVVCSMRTFTKIYIMRQWFLEDYIFILATVLAIVLFSLSLHPALRGARDVGNVPIADLGAWFYWVNVVSTLWNPAMLLARLSNILQLQRFFVVTRRSRVWWACCVVVGLCVVGYSVLFFLSIFQCSEIETAWDPDRYAARGRCPEIVFVTIASGCLNVLLNLVTFITPFTFLWRLSVPQRTKIMASVIFSVDCVALACAFGRLLAIFRVWEGDNFSHDLVAVLHWENAEMFFVLLATCTPLFPTLYHWVCDHNTGLGEASDEEYLMVPRLRRRTSHPYQSLPSSANTSDSSTVEPPPTAARPPISSVLGKREKNTATVGPRSQAEIDKAIAKAKADNERLGITNMRLINREEWDGTGVDEKTLKAMRVQIV